LRSWQQGRQQQGVVTAERLRRAPEQCACGSANPLRFAPEACEVEVRLENLILTPPRLDHPCGPQLAELRADIPRAAVEAAAAHVNAEGFVHAMGGYGAQIRERGSNLSGGQRQLLAFARALAHDPGILILDEATASIDRETEWLIQDALAKRRALYVKDMQDRIQRGIDEGELPPDTDPREAWRLAARPGWILRIALAMFVEPKKAEMSVRIPPEKLNPKKN